MKANWKIILGGLLVLGVADATGAPMSPASQIEFQDDCSLSEKVDLLGTGTVEFKIAKGAIFLRGHTDDGASGFCGQVSQHTPPLGWLTISHCVATNGASLVQFPGSNKIVRSDCRVTYADAVAPPKSGTAVSGPAGNVASAANEPTSVKPVGSSVAASGGAGAWSVDDKTSQLDGSRTYIATLSSSNTIPNAIGAPDTADLIIRCKQGKLELYIHWPPFMGDSDHSVQWKFDEGQIWKQNWSGSEDGTATFNPTPRDFLSAMRGARKLVVDTYPYQSDSVEAVFDLAGGDTVISTVTSACPND